MLLKIYNLLTRQKTNPGQVDLTGKFIPYFQLDGDGFPIELSKLVDNSPTATACISTICDFIIGEGLNSEDLEKKKMDYNGTDFLRFHAQTSKAHGKFWGFAWLIRYSKVGKITEVINLEFQNTRLGIPDERGVIGQIAYNPYFGTSQYRLADTKHYPVYNPGAAALQVKDPNFKGQILFYGATSARSPFYPVPDYYSARNWMAVEDQASVYYKRNLQNGYIQSVLMKMIGDPNDPSGVKRNPEDPNSEEYSKQEYMDEVLTDEFSGAERANKMWVLWGANKEEWPELTPFPSNGNSDVYRVQDEHAIKKITIAMKVPGVLANINDTNNFSGEQIRPAVALMQQRVVPMQDIQIMYYQDVLKNMVEPFIEPISIVKYNPFPEVERVEDMVWAELTTEERRRWIKDHTEINLDDTVQATSAPPAAQNFQNMSFRSYPKKASDNAKKALDWLDKMGVKCSGKAGIDMAKRIQTGENLSMKEIKRLSNYLSKNVVHSGKPFDSTCGAVEFNLWGGPEMMVWANDKIKEINE